MTINLFNVYICISYINLADTDLHIYVCPCLQYIMYLYYLLVLGEAQHLYDLRNLDEVEARYVRHRQFDHAVCFGVHDTRTYEVV